VRVMRIAWQTAQHRRPRTVGHNTGVRAEVVLRHAHHGFSTRVISCVPFAVNFAHPAPIAGSGHPGPRRRSTRPCPVSDLKEGFPLPWTYPDPPSTPRCASNPGATYQRRGLDRAKLFANAGVYSTDRAYVSRREPSFILTVCQSLTCDTRQPHNMGLAPQIPGFRAAPTGTVRVWGPS
jgi:hypothetical protein